jgi:regulator of sigma E protease
MHGFVGIAHVGTRVAMQGWTYLLFFLGLISVNLAVINFLPIPIVDGGLMTFLIIEKLKGSPLSPRFQTVATIVGLAMIGSIFLITLFYDVARLIS